MFVAFGLPGTVLADQFINLTPQPRTLNAGTGELVLPQQFSINVADLSEEMVAEAQKFADALQKTTGYKITLNSQSGTQDLFCVKKSTAPLDQEGYKINVTDKNVSIEAHTATGLYYAFQSIKKVLPPNVMAGVKDAGVTRYALPVLQLDDAPRYGYRGFMLDTSRHFFSVKELKRVLEVMSYYKMNRFHWHITDDHGWRVEIKKYPKLTSVGSISDNSYMVDMEEGDFWLNRPYGPHFYTQDEVREVVAYAKERHIEIIPEIDMPGHFSAAIAAYPEFSCNPDASYNVISNIGGVFNNILNVANPGAVQFAKDILTEIMDLFPGEYIHIGGDECPTTAWEHNAECIAKKKELGLKSFRELQSHFIKDMAEHLKSKGRKISVWNEAITAQGSDTKIIQETDATVYCWVGADGAAAQAANLKLDHIYTPQIPWYINRKQSTDPGEPIAAGNGTDNLEKVYKQNIPNNGSNGKKHLTGVQGTFWCEYVAFGDYLEYLMLPRLVAIAEAGWTQKEKMNFENFCQRITADSTLYNYNGYRYGKHYMKGTGAPTEKVMPMVSNTEKQYWYRLVTRATSERADKCIELLKDGSPLISQYQNNGAKAGRLWTNAQAQEGDAAYDCQFWALEEDSKHPGHYALVCKAQPEGSLKPTPTAQDNSGRWEYDAQQKHYNFILADNGYGKDGESYYYSIRCDQINGKWLNASMGGQGFAVNLYNNPSDGNGGLWKFIAKDPIADTGSADQLRSEARLYLNGVKTYATPEEKQPGYFGKTETDALQQLVNQDITALTPEQMKEYYTRLQEAYQRFRKSFGYLEPNKTYRLSNSVDGYEGTALYDTGKGNALRHTTDVWTDDAWTVTSSTIHDDMTQTVQLQNVQTRRFIGAPAGSVTARVGYAVNMAAQGAAMSCNFKPEEREFVLSLNGKNLYPLTTEAPTLPGTVCAGSDTQTGNAIRRQGAAWLLEEVSVVTFNCYDEAGKFLSTFRRSWPVHAGTTATPPAIPHHEFVKTEKDKSIYRRTEYAVHTVCRDASGALIAAEETACPVGKSHTVQLPEYPYYTFKEANYANGQQVVPEDDMTIEAVYTTNAYNGVKRLGDAVKEVKAGHSYVIYDTSPNDAARKGYRNVNRQMQVMRNTQIENTNPDHTWTLEAAGNAFKVKNAYRDLYVPQLRNSTPATLSQNGERFTFTLNADGETWKIKGANGVCWDGLASGALVGWNDPGHPYMIYEYFAQPYFLVTVEFVDTEGKTLKEPQSDLVKAGEAFTLTTSPIEGYTLKTVEGGEELKAVGDHLKVKVVYESELVSGIDEVKEQQQKEGIYDLSGRRLQRISHKGIYIINGQKVLIR